MRLLVVGHAYVVAENRKKIRALASEPGVDVALVTPHAWPEPLVGALRPSFSPDEPFDARAIHALGAGQEQFHVYLSPDLGMRRFRPDVVYVEQGAGSFVYAQALACRRAFAPRARAAFFTWWNLPYRASRPLAAVERFNLARSQGAVAGNGDAAAIVRDHGFAGAVAVLPQLGVDSVQFRPRDAADVRRRLGLDRFTIGFAGRFVETKGLRVLLEALDRAPFDFQLLLVGKGPLDAEMRAYAAEKSWGSRLVVVSDVGHAEIAELYPAMDVLVLPSLTRPPVKEQFGHVLIEAMACGVPVVGSTSGEIPNVIADAGLVVPEGDAAALRDALASMADSPERRRALGEAGRRRVLDLYTHEGIARRLVSFLGSL